MNAVFVALLCGSLVFATSEYSALENAIAQSPIHTIRLTELQAKVQAQGPMDKIGDLANQQMREITQELANLQTAHSKFQSDCQTAFQKWATTTNRLFAVRSMALTTASQKYNQWNSIKNDGNLENRRRRRETELKRIHDKEAEIARAYEERQRQHAEYLVDMADFTQGKADLDEISKILANSALGNKTTSANTAAGANGFLEVVDNVKSEFCKYQTNRLVRAANFLEEQIEDGVTGVDKLNNLLNQMRNELNAEQKVLIAAENTRVYNHRVYLINARRVTNALHVSRARHYWHMGQQLSRIGQVMQEEAIQNILAAKTFKRMEEIAVLVEFEEDKCSAEPPLYQKMRANKLAEVSTLKQMLQILTNLNWSGAVYQAIARISVGGGDDNPEPGYTLGFQMDISAAGLGKGLYAINSKSMPAFKRVAVKLQIGSNWVWASFDAWDKDTKYYLMPTKTNGLVQQRYVDNLHIFSSASANVVQGVKAQGNVEIWANVYRRDNANAIPGADDGAYDFGDARQLQGTYGCFQVHDFSGAQTLLAVNNLFTPQDEQYDVGLGNAVNAEGRATADPDWTKTHSYGDHKSRRERVTLTWYFQ